MQNSDVSMYNPDAKQRTEHRDTGSVPEQDNYVLTTMKKIHYIAVIQSCSLALQCGAGGDHLPCS